MPCDDCRQKSAPISATPVTYPAPRSRCGIGAIIYTGGPKKAVWAAMQAALPPGYERARILDDGTVQYKKGLDGETPPSPMDGFEFDEGAWAFRPLWQPCQSRVFLLRVTPECQCVSISARCLNPESGQFGKVVACKQCEECLHRRPIP